MVDTVVSSATKEVVIGFERPFCVIGERINPTGRKLLAAEMAGGDYSRVEADALAQVPGGLAAVGAHALAARLLGFAEAHWVALSGPMYRQLERDLRRTRLQLHQALGTQRLALLRTEGRSLDLPSAVALALGDEGAAAAQAHQDPPLFG